MTFRPFDEYAFDNDAEDEEEIFAPPPVDMRDVELAEPTEPIVDLPRILAQCRACKLDMLLVPGATRPPSVCPACRSVNAFLVMPVGAAIVENANPSRKRPPRAGPMPFPLRPHLAPRPQRERAQTIRMSDVDTTGTEIRHLCGIPLLDRAMGLADSPGHVVGDCSMWGGPPGTGKSTLLLQALQGYARAGLTCVYSAGEEALRRVVLRAKRIGLTTEEMNLILLMRNNDTDDFAAAVIDHDADIGLMDSAQTHLSRNCDGRQKSILQIQYTSLLCSELAHGDEDKSPTARFKGKRPRIIKIISHADKNGDMAGPNASRHDVDELYLFEHFDPQSLDTLEPKNRIGFVRVRVEKNRSGDAQGCAVTDDDGEETDLEFQWVKPGKVVQFDRLAWLANRPSAFSGTTRAQETSSKEEAHE